MSVEYHIDPDFVVPDPTPADFFCFCAEDECTDEFKNELFDQWRKDGVKQARMTLVNEQYPESGYPHGVWFEGWLDESARQLAFGAPWPSANGAIWPALTATPPASADTHAKRGDSPKIEAPSPMSGAVPNASEADAHD